MIFTLYLVQAVEESKWAQFESFDECVSCAFEIVTSRREVFMLA